jgi:hypothetical protein
MANGACVDSVQDAPVSAPAVTSKDTQTGGNAAAAAMSWTTPGVPSEAPRAEGEIRWQQSASWSSWACFGLFDCVSTPQQQDGTRRPIIRQ